MTIGSLSARAGSGGAGIPKKLLSLLMAAVLALSLVPSAAWAQPGAPESALNEAPAAASEAAAPEESAGPVGEASEGSSAEEEPGTSGNTVGDDSSAADDAPGAEDPDRAAAGTEPASPEGSQASAPDAAGATGASVLSAAGEADAGVETLASSSLTNSCFASITTSPNAIRPQAPSGFVYAGTTLYASAWKSSTSKVGDDGTWTYAWYASAQRSPNSLSAADRIDGQGGSSLALTDELAATLEGKYLFAQITSGDGVAVSGPRQASRPTGNLYGVGSVKAPVPAKTALDDKSYILIQSSADASSSYDTVEAAALHVGESLFANAYDSEATPDQRIAAQDRWTYQWLAGDSRDADDSAYEAIVGQTGRSLAITEELASQLAGKYLRVKVTGDGQELFGPSGAFDRPSSTTYDTPGPVVAPGQIVVSHVILAYNGAGFGNESESVPNANVGDVIEAAAYDKDDPSTLYRDDRVDFSWQVSDSAAGPFREVATGDAYTVGSYAGKYLKVVATAKQGVPGFGQHETEAGRILAQGVATLSRVSILNAGKAAMDTGTTLEAMAYTGDYWSETAVTEGVSYTWRWSDKDPDSYAVDFDPATDWHVIGGVTGDSLTVPAGFEGRWIAVSAYAGDNVVESDDSSAAGPFKKPGTIELYYAALNKVAGDDTFVYKAGETIGVTARATSAAGTAGVYLADDQLSFTWKVSDSWNGEFVELADENVHKSSFVIPASYVGKYLQCEVSAGFNTEVAGTMRNAIAEAPDYAAPLVAKVELSSSGAPNALVPGDRLTARAFDAAGKDVTDEIAADRWSWGTAAKPSASAVNVTFLKDCYEANVLKAVPSDERIVGKYLVAQVSNEPVDGTKKKVKGVSAVAVSAVAAPVYELSSMGVASSGNLVQVGNTLTPQPRHLVGSGEWAYEDALPGDAVVAYTWYAADDAAGTNEAKVPGADAATGALVLTEALQGKYVHVVANAGANEVCSEPLLVESADVRRLTVGVKVTGTTRHQVGEDYSAEAWIPLTEFAWSSDAKATAWDAFSKLLDEAGYFYDLTGGVPYSITTPDKTYTLAMSASAPWSYWSFFVNGQYASEMANGYALKDGDTIELRYIDAASSEKPSGDVTVNPDAEHPDLGADWGGFGKGDAGSVVQDVPTPTEKADAAWTSSLLTDEERAAGAYAYASEPLIVGGKLYVVSGSSFYDFDTSASVTSLARVSVIDPATGAVEKRKELATSMDSVCRPVYADGIVVIPLSGGYLQAVSASTLDTLWVVAGIDGAQSLSSLEVSEGYVYVSTADALDSSYHATSGTIRRINLHTGALASVVANDSAGYYWSGGITVDGHFLVPDDSGRITSYSSDLSEQLDSVKTGEESFRSSLVCDGGYVYAVSTKGTLYKLSVDAGGKLEVVGSASFAAYSTSTPAISGGKAFVGGSLSGYEGVLAIIDLATMTVTQVAKADGAELPAEVKSAPLVSVQNGQTYVYFTCNTATPSRSTYSSGGGVYVYRMGDAEASALYDPTGELANYCMASVIAGPDGTLYYTNDSGHLFALKAKSGEGSGGTEGEGSGGTEGEGSGTGEGSGSGTEGSTGEGDSDNQGNHGGSGGYVPPAKMPLTAQAKALQVETGTAADNGDAVKDGRDVAKSVSSAGSTAGTVDSGADGAEAAAEGAPGGVNPWAVGGIALGVVGLACAVAYVARSKRRAGGVS